MAQTPEGKVKAAIKKYLVAAGAWFCMPATGGYGKSGVPDFLVCRPVIVTPDMVGKMMGQFVAIEAKAPGKLRNTTTMQDQQIAEIGAAGGIAFVADGVSVLDRFLVSPQSIIKVLT